MKPTSNALVEKVLRGLAQDWTQLESMDRAVVSLMRDARAIAEKSFAGKPPADWDARWRELEQTLNLMRAHAAKTRELIESADKSPGDSAPLDGWREIGRLDATLESVLESLQRDSEPPADAPHRKEFEGAWNALNGYLRAMRAHSAAMTMKLEMCRRYGREEAGRLTDRILSRLPDGSPNLIEPERFEKVAFQLHEEHHQFKGFWDVARALLMFWETPDERLAKKEAPLDALTTGGAAVAPERRTNP